MKITAKKLTARFYETHTGHKPVREWLLELAPENRRIVGYDIETVEFGGLLECQSVDRWVMGCGKFVAIFRMEQSGAFCSV